MIRKKWLVIILIFYIFIYVFIFIEVLDYFELYEGRKFFIYAILVICSVIIIFSWEGIFVIIVNIDVE